MSPLTVAEPLYRIHVVAERVGVSEPVLRMWERRYQLLTPKRTPGGFRAYTETDIALLQRVVAHVRAGMSIGEVAPLVPAMRRELKAAPAIETKPVIAAAPSLSPSQRTQEWLDQGLAAAKEHNQPAIEQLLDEVLSTLPPLNALELVLMPLQRAVGDAWHQRTLSTAQEHLISHAVRTRILGLFHSSPRQALQHVLCACFPEEDHDIGLLGAALRFRHAGFQVTYLGARTPAKELGAAVRELHPDWVALSVVKTMSPTAFETQLKAVVDDIGLGPRMVIGGPGAEKHGAAIKKAGVWLISTPEDWAQLFATAQRTPRRDAKNQ